MRVFRNPEVAWREEDALKEALEGLGRGEDVSEVGTSILFLDGNMLSLNIVATEVWRLCDGKTPDEMMSELMQKFEVEPSVLSEDVMGLLSELEEKGFLYFEN